ncbi:hypothetical protein KP509_37G041900 [Ceratopteris richardii]|nr:hypothetical protein KP509_37G041900 [Ceratopteris richardii]
MWYPYLALLPTESEMAELHPLMWPQGLSEEWLSGSPMLLKLQQRFLNCREDYEALVAAGGNFLFPPEKSIDAIVTEISTRWAASILLSRAFSLDLTNELDDDEFSEHSTVLVPWADMLNHSSLCGKESCLVYDSIKKLACLHASKDYLEGEQVFDSYGPNLSPSDLLLDYGFVDQENNNHRVDLPASCLGPVTGSANDDLLRSIGLPPDGAIFSITEDGVDETALAWTRAAVASIKELASVGWTEGKHSQEKINTRGNMSMACFLKPVSHENESEVMRRLLSACGNVLTQYQTTLDEDHAMVDNEVDKVKVSWAQAQAKLAIISEKKALRGAWKQFYVKLKKLENGGNFRRSSQIKRTN